MTAEREHLINTFRDLLVQGTLGTQEELCQALALQGFDVNQSRVSRLLRKVGAVKTKNAEGSIVYCLPKEPAPPTAMSHLSHLIMAISANEQVIIVHTSPGSASLIARLLDHQREKLNVLGTIAGDDTILVIPQQIRDLEMTLSAVKQLLAEV